MKANVEKGIVPDVCQKHKAPALGGGGFVREVQQDDQSIRARRMRISATWLQSRTKGKKSD
jgi:hypothetical protein